VVWAVCRGSGAGVLGVKVRCRQGGSVGGEACVRGPAEPCCGAAWEAERCFFFRYRMAWRHEMHEEKVLVEKKEAGTYEVYKIDGDKV